MNQQEEQKDKDRAASMEDELSAIMSGRKGGLDSGLPPYLEKVKELVEKIDKGDKSIHSKDILRTVIDGVPDSDHLVLLVLPCPKGKAGHDAPQIYGSNSGMTDILEALNEAHYKYTRLLMGQEPGAATDLGMM